jgi:uncharacterized membrane protein HdeD (DUF308 family)
MGPPGRLAAQIWWIFVVTGIGLFILGASVLVKSPESTLTLARIAGITFIADALLLSLLASQAEEWRGFYMLGALTGIAGVGLAAFFEGRGAFLLAMILAAALILRGLIDSLVGWTGVTDFTDTAGSSWAWILLGVGIVNLLLGLLALVTYGGSTFILLLIVGGHALARGIGMVAVSVRLRGLT